MKKDSSKKRKNDVEITYSNNWIYVLLLTTLVIFTESIKGYTFKVAYIDLTYSLFLLPFSYFIVNIITKKYGYEQAIKAISVSGISLVLFVALVDLISGNGILLNNVYGNFCGYVVSSFVNLTIYYFLLSNTSSPSLVVFLNYIFVLIVNHFIFMLISFDSLSLNYFWISYFSALFIQILICICLTFIDNKIKRGV